MWAVSYPQGGQAHAPATEWKGATTVMDTGKFTSLYAEMLYPEGARPEMSGVGNAAKTAVNRCRQYRARWTNSVGQFKAAPHDLQPPSL